MTDNTRTQTSDDFDWFKQNGIFMPMINDTARNIFYKSAIERSVKDKVVCDIGTGTGFLSIIAAKAGAKKVYAVEMDPGRAAFAQEMIAKVGLSDTIEVINNNFLNTDIAADIYVSETIGTQIFNENIINLSAHALKHGGVFIPSTFEITAKVFRNHAIFPVVQGRSDAFEFQPDIEIDPVFENEINSAFQAKHDLKNTLYRANYIDTFFTQLKKMPDINLRVLYETQPLIVDLNQPINVEDIRITIPESVMTDNICVVIFWKAKFQDLTMVSTDTIWGHMSKIILPRVKKPGVDITTWFDPEMNDWRFEF